MPAQPHRLLFKVDDYYRMADAGILAEDDPVELIEGEVIRMSPAGSHHASRVKKLNRLLTTRLGEEAIVAVQDPVHLSDLSSAARDFGSGREPTQAALPRNTPRNPDKWTFFRKRALFDCISPRFRDFAR